MLLVFTTLSLHSCHFISSQKSVRVSKNYITKDYDTGFFQQINSNLSAKVYIVQSEEFSVSAYAPDNLLPSLKIFVKGNTLYLKAENSRKSTIQKIGNKHITIHISVPDLTNITQNGVGDITIEDKATFDTLTLRLSGVGDIHCEDLTCKQLKVTHFGVGDINLKGKSQSAWYKSNAVGDINAKKMLVSSLTVKHSGVGDVICHAVEELNINTGGVGDVIYYGNPAIKDIHKGNIGKVKHK